jgi:hypothetical protein
MKYKGKYKYKVIFHHSILLDHSHSLHTSFCKLPPTTLKESFDQLVYLQDKRNRYRRYLAKEWWTFTCSSASTRPRHFENIFDRDAEVRDIRELCSCIDLDLQNVDLRLKRFVPNPLEFRHLMRLTQAAIVDDFFSSFFTEEAISTRLTIAVVDSTLGIGTRFNAWLRFLSKLSLVGRPQALRYCCGLPLVSGMHIGLLIKLNRYLISREDSPFSLRRRTSSPDCISFWGSLPA